MDMWTISEIAKGIFYLSICTVAVCVAGYLTGRDNCRNMISLLKHAASSRSWHCSLMEFFVNSKLTSSDPAPSHYAFQGTLIPVQSI